MYATDETPKAFTNSSPGLLQPWDPKTPRYATLKALANVEVALAKASSVIFFLPKQPQGCRNPRDNTARESATLKALVKVNAFVIR